ncbi:MAG: dephospho-CoA kinase [Verrucomicrobiales bacterium]
MQTACLTGGVATGKSEFVRLFTHERTDVDAFDCDRAVHGLLAEPAMAAQVEAALGRPLAGCEGGIDRKVLREIVFADASARLTLEALLHPEVRRLCLAARDQAAATPGVRLFLAEVPLLYESAFDVARDYEIVVASSPATQRSRLQERRRIDPATAERILSAQLPMLQKVERADIVVWNGGSLECLKRQAHYLRKRLGLPS